MKKRLISVFVFALAVSAGAAFVLYQLISSKVTAGAAASRPATKMVFVAARDLEPGVLVTEQDVIQQAYISMPAGAIAKKEDIVNRGVTNAIHKDTPFFEGMLAARGAGAGFASLIPQGMRALAVKVNEVAGVAGFAVAGVHVDVLVAGNPPGGGHEDEGSVSRTLLQNISVLSAGQNYQKDTEGKPVLVTVVNLLVTPAQAEILNLATDQRIQLVLRNPTDQAITNTPGAATSSLFDGNVIRAPRPVLASNPPHPNSGNAIKPKPSPLPVAAAPTPAPAPPVHAPTVEVLSGTARTEVVVAQPATTNASTEKAK